MVDQVLIITNSLIGDTILSTGAIDEISRRHAGAALTLVTPPLIAPLFTALPGLVEVVPFTKRRRGAHWLSLYRRLGLRRWTAIYDFRKSAIAPMLRGPVHRPRRTDSPAHKVEEAASILGQGEIVRPTRLWNSGSSETLDNARPILALGPGASRVGKAWPAEKFARSVQLLTSSAAALADARVIVVGGPADAAAAKAILEAAPSGGTDLTGLPLAETADALAQANLFIGNDSGMMHLAAATGARTLGLFGPTDERLYGPWGDRTAVVRPEGVAFTFGKTSRTVSQTETQMDALTVDQVVAAAEDLLLNKSLSDPFQA